MWYVQKMEYHTAVKNETTTAHIHIGEFQNYIEQKRQVTEGYIQNGFIYLMSQTCNIRSSNR